MIEPGEETPEARAERDRCANSLQQHAERIAREATGERERMALAMARVDLRPRCNGLDAFLYHVERTWQRYIPEAQALLAEIAALEKAQRTQEGGDAG